MKGNLAFSSLVVFLAGTAFGQAKPAEKPKPATSEVTTVKTETKTVPGGVDLTWELWSFEDANPVREGQLDLRFTSRWIPDPANDDDDDIIFQPSLVWGPAANWELSATVPIWVGDAGDRGGYKDGNYDTYLGALWKFKEQEGYWPAAALAGHARVPTGEGSSGIDGELRLALTNEYDSGIRSHLNFWGKTANGDNDGRETRDFQYGGVVGLDGPLCAGGKVRWVADYAYQISNLNGSGGEHLADVGFEWRISDVHLVGMSGQLSLDHSNESLPDYGVSVTWAISLHQ